MSKISIQGDGQGTGTFTLKSPASNNNRQFDLPDEAGTVLTNASDISAANLTGDVAAERITNALNATGSAPIYACRAWVNFDGTGTVSIRDSGNVSSITDNGTGNYTVNFTTAMPDANYSVVASSSNNTGAALFNTALVVNQAAAPTTTSARIQTGAVSNATGYDCAYVCVSIFR